MNHAQLRSFHAVAAEGGFTAASRILNVGQPTITTQVPFDLAEELKTPRNITLT